MCVCVFARARVYSRSARRSRASADTAGGACGSGAGGLSGGSPCATRCSLPPPATPTQKNKGEETLRRREAPVSMASTQCRRRMHRLRRPSRLRRCERWRRHRTKASVLQQGGAKRQPSIVYQPAWAAQRAATGTPRLRSPAPPRPVSPQRQRSALPCGRASELVNPSLRPGGHVWPRPRAAHTAQSAAAVDTQRAVCMLAQVDCPQTARCMSRTCSPK